MTIDRVVISAHLRRLSRVAAKIAARRVRSIDVLDSSTLTEPETVVSGRRSERVWTSIRKVGFLANLRCTRTTLVSVIALTTVAAVLRFWRLTAVGFRGDEAVYAGQAALIAHRDGMSRWFIPASRGNSNFLVFQWIVSVVYRVFGVSDLAARSVSAVLSTLTVMLAYLIGRQLYGQRAGLLAGLLLALSGYAIGLGRLALLDASLCFFITVTFYCLLKWQLSDQLRWLAALTVSIGIVAQIKVVGILVLPAVLLFMIFSGSWRRITRRHLLIVVGLGALSLLPALMQIVSDHGHQGMFLQASVKRSSGVPWYYYMTTLWSAEGALLFGLFAAGIGLAAVRRDRRDLLPALWLLVFAVFLQVYPLKAFNYLLPVLPPLALLGGHALAVGSQMLTQRWRSIGLAVTATALAAVCVLQFMPVRTAIANESSVGMREAAYWLRDHGAQRAGTLALSHGSGQYTLSFYGGVDSYPFGRFRISTVLPGGEVVQARARSDGRVPTDWVDYWPARLIEEGRISYLVYNTRPVDDPPEQDQISHTVTERQFQSLIQLFGGRLVDTIYHEHEARVYIYKVSKRLAHPVLNVKVIGSRVLVRASGFVTGSPLTVAYHGLIIGRMTADANGTGVVIVPVPDPGQSEYHLSVRDVEGNAASVTGLPSTKVLYTVTKGIVDVFGVQFRPHSRVLMSYGTKSLGETTARADGTIDFRFGLPKLTHSRFRIRAVDDSGHTAWATGLQPPSLAYVVRGTEAEITGAHYLPDSPIRLTYRGTTVATARADGVGTFKVRFVLPRWAARAYLLIAVDRLGRRASVTGLRRA